MNQDKSSNLNPLVGALAEMNREANFSASAISGKDGLLVAASGEKGNSQTQSAVVAKLNEAALLVHSQMAIGAPDEFSLNTDSGSKLICRPFQLNGHDLILTVLVPKRGQAYRRATSRAINRLRSAWSQ